MFNSTDKKGKFINENNFVIDFRYIISEGYYFVTNDSHNQVKKYLREFSGNFVLEHWNKPEGKCALWDSKDNNYITPDLPLIKQPFLVQESYRVEMTYQEKIKPTYVIFYPYAHLIFEQNLWSVQQDE